MDGGNRVSVGDSILRTFRPGGLGLLNGSERIIKLAVDSKNESQKIAALGAQINARKKIIVEKNVNWTSRIK